MLRSIVSCCCGADAGIKLILLTAEMKRCVCRRALMETNEYSKTHLTSKLRKKFLLSRLSREKLKWVSHDITNPAD